MSENRLHLVHKYNAMNRDYLSLCIGPSIAASKQPDIPPDWRWRVLMKNLILAAFAALSLTAAVAPLANAATFHNGSTVAGDQAATAIQQQYDAGR